MTTLIKNGRVIDPSINCDKIIDILIEDNIIKQIGENLTTNVDNIIDAQKKWVVPGLIDIHVHLRDPGYEYKETIETGSKSAAKGGFTTICCMPNTNPVIDNKTIVEYIKLKAEKYSCVNVLPIGSITKGQKGEELSDIEQMVKSGACAISEDGKTVINTKLLKEAMKLGTKFNIPMMSHCEDINLVQGGAMNEGTNSQRLGIKGISNDSEEVIEARDIIIAKSTGIHLHLCHISTKGSVQLLREAKNKNENVSAEVCPHHFILTDEIIKSDDTNTKMNPPLRTAEDVDALKKGLADGTIEVIATDHAPHHVDDKNCDYHKAAFGIVGLETSLALCITELVDKNYLTPLQLIAKMSTNPAKILGIDKGTLQIGKIADITIIDPNIKYKIDVNTFESKGKNTPFNNYEVKGRAVCTIVNGKIVYEDVLYLA